MNQGTGTDTGTDTGTCTQTATCECELCKKKAGTGELNPEIPQELRGIHLPPGVIDKFPFSIPFTLIAVFTVLNAKAEAPVFAIPFAVPMLGIHEEITVDLSMFEPVINILRWLLTLLFIFGLTMATRALIKG
jgi:hypothetical protein